MFSRKENLSLSYDLEINLSSALEGDIVYTNICTNITKKLMPLAQKMRKNVKDTDNCIPILRFTEKKEII